MQSYAPGIASGPASGALGSASGVTPSSSPALSSSPPPPHAAKAGSANTRQTKGRRMAVGVLIAHGFTARRDGTNRRQRRVSDVIADASRATSSRTQPLQRAVSYARLA